MAENKTKATNASVDRYLAAIDDDARRTDCAALAKLMSKATKQPATMWGTSIVGFGSTALRYASGRELDWPVVAVSPRKAATTVYLMDGFEERADLLARLGPHSVGKSCLYLKRLSDVDLDVLRELVAESVR